LFHSVFALFHDDVVHEEHHFIPATRRALETFQRNSKSPAAPNLVEFFVCFSICNFVRHSHTVSCLLLVKIFRFLFNSWGFHIEGGSNRRKFFPHWGFTALRRGVDRNRETPTPNRCDFTSLSVCDFTSLRVYNAEESFQKSKMRGSTQHQIGAILHRYRCDFTSLRVCNAEESFLEFNTQAEFFLLFSFSFPLFSSFPQ
jgi:hypothetical protein